jgi:hypothetical protein
VLPISAEHPLSTYSRPYISGGGKRIFWSLPPDDSHQFRELDLATGKAADLVFPEQVSYALSPDGARVLAVGVDTGTLYLARLSADGTQWRVEQVPLG